MRDKVINKNIVQDANENANPRIYVVDLFDYNSGKLHGVWIDVTQDLDVIWDEINAMLAKSPEGSIGEWCIHDYENFYEYSLSGDESIELVHEIALFINEYQDLAVAALEYFEGLAEAKKMVAENYHGCYESEEAFAEELYNHCYEVPDYIQPYIDYELVARDVFMGGYFVIEAPDYKIYVFARG